MYDSQISVFVYLAGLRPTRSARIALGRLCAAEAAIEAAPWGNQSDLPVSCRSPKTSPPTLKCLWRPLRSQWAADQPPPPPLSPASASLRAAGTPAGGGLGGGASLGGPAGPHHCGLVGGCRASAPCRPGVCMPPGRGRRGDRSVGPRLQSRRTIASPPVAGGERAPPATDRLCMHPACSSDCARLQPPPPLW